MAITEISCFAGVGLQAYHITIEVDANKALPTIEIIGLPDAAIKEAKERIKASFRNCNIKLPAQKIIVNLSPSDIKKVGTRFDLPIAVAIFSYFFSNNYRQDKQELLQKSVFFGELGLDGSVKSVTGLLPSVLSAYEQGFTHFFVPEVNVQELLCLPEIKIYGLTSFGQLVDFLQQEKTNIAIHTGFLERKVKKIYQGSNFDDIKGQNFVKRALLIAAAGMHNVLMIGPPGSGKTMLAKAIPSVLPEMQFSEQIEVSKIYSVVGKLNNEQPMITQRPFRIVHHTASKIAIVGGGQYMTPGEISLAHRGVLFFDELPEFPREVLEVLRQPIEDKQVVISRAHGSVQYPADFMFVAAMNPCKCGYYQDKEKQCSCSYLDIQRYQSKISGPLLDRFDMIIEVPRESLARILDQETQKNQEQRQEQVIKAQELQKERFKQYTYATNAQIQAKDIQNLIPLQEEVNEFFKKAVTALQISPRLLHRIQKIARTIADLEGAKTVSIQHIAEALQYRSKLYFIEK